MARLWDGAEAWVNAAVGLCVSWALVFALRKAGLWDAPAMSITAVFFASSMARSYVVRRLFRGWQDAGD